MPTVEVTETPPQLLICCRQAQCYLRRWCHPLRLCHHLELCCPPSPWTSASQVLSTLTAPSFSCIGKVCSSKIKPLPQELSPDWPSYSTSGSTSSCVLPESPS